MVSRRQLLILGGTSLLPACSGGSASHALLPGNVSQGSPAPPIGPYGAPIANWSTTLATAGDAHLAVTDQPSALASSQALRLGWALPASAAQQAVLAPTGALVPAGRAPGFSVALWVRNPGPRTLAFRLRLFDSTGRSQIVWNCAADPLGRWILLTLSPTQQALAKWNVGQDAVAAVRIEQHDDSPEGPWQPGDTLTFGDIYVDVPGQALFVVTFDDGFASQHTPAPPLDDSSANVVTATRDNLFFTAGNHTVVMGDPIIFPGAVPPGVSASTRYWVQSVPAPNAFTLAADATLKSGIASSGFAGSAPFMFDYVPTRSGRQIVESHGFKGSLFLVPDWLGTTGKYGYTRRPNRFMSVADALDMHAQGWSIGSHSFSHPSSAENAGLRLLGPYGYFLSNPVDFLPDTYVRAWRLDASFRRRAIHAAPGTNLVTFENPHRFLVNMPIMFVGAAPAGFAPDTVYYCQSVASPVSATFATDQGSLAATVTVPADWTGLAAYRYPGAALDDSAIYNDIEAGIAGLEALGIATARRFFALPQGCADVYVRSACLRARVSWVRGASDRAHTIATGYPSGSGLSNVANTPGGWLAQPDCIQTDNPGKPTIRDIVGYIDDGIAQHACGCSYHHWVSGATEANLENMCAALRTREDAGLVKVVTLDQMAALLGR